MGKGHLTSLVRLSYLAPDIVRALLKGRLPIELTPTRLLRLSKDLPHDWIEHPRFRRRKVHNFRPERSITPDPKTVARDPATVRAPHPGVWRLWLSPMRLSES
jgi:hypothetical protein